MNRKALLLWPIRVSTVLLSAQLLGCATAPPVIDSPPESAASAVERTHWQGRMSVKVGPESGSDAGAQNASFFAPFELEGRASEGELRIYSPLGQVLGQLRWQPGWAQLRRGSSVREAQDLSTLLRELTRTDVPVQAWFDWMQGRLSPVPGWDVQLDQWQAGRLGARREWPEPSVELRLVWQP